MAGGIAGNLVMGVARLAAMNDAIRTNAEKCKEIKRIANRARKDLQARKGNINNNSSVRDALDDLEESIRRALRLVRACQTRDLNFLEQVLRLYRAEDITKELQQVQEDMSLKLAAATFAIINNHGMAPNANPAGHRPPQLQQERWTPEEHAHRRHQRHAHQRPHQQGHHPILPQRQRLDQHAPQRSVVNALAMLGRQMPVVERAHGRPEHAQFCKFSSFLENICVCLSVICIPAPMECKVPGSQALMPVQPIQPLSLQMISETEQNTTNVLLLEDIPRLMKCVVWMSDNKDHQLSC
ncbi:unnamed protein product [Miscanthus lutarioriparius]|uniref:Uncharacterized protein n=1 Tax=Miscanthus lutarioriparius TaxID=422564 RepID=A0A811QIV3_9POAL|nr:unnamed protein product [Miscanthus lutarioriparius]